MLKNADNTTKLFLIGIVFLVMILYILVTSIQERNSIDYSIAKTFVNKLDDNYTLNIESDNKIITYSKDKDVEIYESSDFENNKYIKYNGKTYIMNNDTFEEIETNKDLEDKYNYDINLIKKVMPYCKYSSPFSNNIVCNISADNYNKEFQSLYGLGRLSNEDVIINFYCNDDSVEKMAINYSPLKYDIKVTDIGNNNYSELIKMIK